MSSRGTIQRIDFDSPADLDRWQAYLASHNGTHCTDFGPWRRLFRELYGIDNYSYVLVADNAITGLVSLYHFRSPFMGNLLVTNPFFGYGGFYAQDDASRDALLTKVRETAESLGVDYVEMRLQARLPPPWEAASDFLESNLTLLETPELVWTKQLSSNVRQNIRRARKSHLEFRLSSDHRPCYRLLCRTLRALGTPFHGEPMFKLLRKHFAAETSFSEVWHKDELMAAGVVMNFGDRLITPFIGSLKQHGQLRANYLQYWGLIEHCFEQGIPCFEFGRSPKGSTHIRFKRKWGAQDVPVSYNYLVVNPRKRYRSVATLPPTYQLATQAWKRLPLVVTSTLGPRLARFVP